MKKSVLVLMVLVIAGAARADVTVTCDQVACTNEVIVSFANDDAEMKVRGFALDITVDDGNIVDVNCTNSEYYLYPGSISIDASGEVSDWGSCLCSPGDHPDTLGGLDSNGVTVEMCSRYGEGGPDPNQSAELLRIRVGSTGTVTVNANAIRGGVVMEDPNVTPTTNLPAACAAAMGCYCGQPDYDQWELVGELICWCYPRQCLGDADGLPYGKDNYWVSVPDLTILKAAWNKTAAELTGNEACADFDHLPYGKDDYRVSVPDLTILKANWNIAGGPAGTCSPGDHNP